MYNCNTMGAKGEVWQRRIQHCKSIELWSYKALSCLHVKLGWNTVLLWVFFSSVMLHTNSYRRTDRQLLLGCQLTTWGNLPKFCGIDMWPRERYKHCCMDMPGLKSRGDCFHQNAVIWPFHYIWIVRDYVIWIVWVSHVRTYVCTSYSYNFSVNSSV